MLLNEELGLDARPTRTSEALVPKGALDEAYVASSLDTSA
jgi:hypothetical protein